MTPKKRKKLDKFTLTITDVNGSRQFYLSAVIKKMLIWLIIFVVAFIVCSSLYIRYLIVEVGDLDAKRSELSALNAQIEQNMSEQAALYQGLESQLKEFEEQLGIINNPENRAPTLTPSARMANLTLTNEQQIEVLAQIPNGWPLEKQVVSGKYGWRTHPITNKREFHAGIDLSAVIDTPVFATANGVVEFSGYNSNGYGQMVVLVHNYGFKTAYAHLNRKVVVSQGQFVKKGDLIGYSGNTGISTGPHLHYEVRFVNRTLEPSYFLNLNRKTMDNFFRQERSVQWHSLVEIIPTQAQQQRPQSSQQAQR